MNKKANPTSPVVIAKSDSTRPMSDFEIYQNLKKVSRKIARRFWQLVTSKKKEAANE
jgi:hypothetical protein